MSKPRAYSYLRFSTPDQSRGDSFRRQADKARKFAAQNDLELSEDSYQDLGVSAYRGRNIVEGQLGKFLEAVESGKIKRGSYLLVENLDRLSRDRLMPALNRFHSILEAGIKIATLNDGTVYTKDSINDLTGLIIPLVYMSRANEESVTKSERGRAAWGEKKRKAREDRKPITSEGPGWLKVEGDRFKVNRERAAVVRLIYQRAADGWGKNRIARQLNVDKVPTFGRGEKWSPYTVRMLCANAATKGTYQPHRNEHDESGRRKRVPDGAPIEGYFPRIIADGLFARAQQARPAPSGSKRTPLPQNMLTGLVRCSKCDAKMYMVNRGNRRRTYRYLVCDNAHRDNTCDARPIPYEPVFNHVISQIEEWGPAQHDPKRSEERAAKIAQLEDDIATARATLKRYLDEFERGEIPGIADRIRDLGDRLSKLQAEHSELTEKTLAEESEKGGMYEEFVDPNGRTIARVKLSGSIEDGRWKSDPATSLAEQYDLLAQVSTGIRRAVERIELEHGKKPRVIRRS